MEIHVRKLGVREVERRQALFWALVFLVIFWSRETKAKKNTVTSGKGKQVLVWIIVKRFEEPGFHLYSISVNLFPELTVYGKLISTLLAPK